MHHRDPVCGMSVDSKSPIKTQYLDQEYYFCCESCKQSFLENPTQYLQSGKFEERKSALRTYFPLLLILAYLLGGVCLIEFNIGSLNTMRAMRNFMGGFFLIFSFFKFLNLKGFVEAYRTYDIVAGKFEIYGWIYPFIELGLGLAYFLSISPRMFDSITFFIMLVSSVGVAKNLYQKKQIQCACLGTVFKLPMTSITLFEDLLMAIMALIGLVSH